MRPLPRTFRLASDVHPLDQDMARARYTPALGESTERMLLAQLPRARWLPLAPTRHEAWAEYPAGMADRRDTRRRIGAVTSHAPTVADTRCNGTSIRTHRA